MTEKIRNHDESRLPPRNADDRVDHSDCRVVEASLMLPADSTAADVLALMSRLYEREPTVLHWSTNWFVPNA